MKPTIPFLCLLLVGACRNPSASDDGAGPAPALTPGGPAPVVTGTVLDARTGKPVAGARVEGPGGVATQSDARGRFVLRGLDLGASGELRASTASGLHAANRLRPLESGALEVVLHLR